MKTIYKKVLISKWFQLVLYKLIRMYSRTFRLSVENEDGWLSILQGGGKILICTWHQQFFSAIRHFKKYQIYKPSLMISQSIDGEIIAGIAKLTGWNPVRGSSSKGGKSALKEMIQALKTTGLAAHIVDGPRGPIGHVKAGAIRLALETGAFIVPFYAAADSAWFFNSWDKFFVPKPFSKVTLRFDGPLKLEYPESESEFETLRQHVETVMHKELKA
ncbi:MAG: lysophospholipid acyltransferase family protein [Pseudomonadota bacterium]